MPGRGGTVLSQRVKRHPLARSAVGDGLGHAGGIGQQPLLEPHASALGTDPGTSGLRTLGCPAQWNRPAHGTLVACHIPWQGGCIVGSGTVDKVTGKVKEVTGQLTGDKRLETEGKTDQVKGNVKNATSKASDTAKGVRDSLAKD